METRSKEVNHVLRMCRRIRLFNMGWNHETVTDFFGFHRRACANFPLPPRRVDRRRHGSTVKKRAPPARLPSHKRRSKKSQLLVEKRKAKKLKHFSHIMALIVNFLFLKHDFFVSFIDSCKFCKPDFSKSSLLWRRPPPRRLRGRPHLPDHRIRGDVEFDRPSILLKNGDIISFTFEFKLHICCPYKFCS